MGLKEKLTTVGSKFTYTADGASPTPYPELYVPSINQLATNQSLLHADLNGSPGYSLNGNFQPQVNNDYIAYKDGAPNFLPQSSIEDLNGVPPTIANHNNFSPNSSTQALPYLNNQPL